MAAIVILLPYWSLMAAIVYKRMALGAPLIGGNDWTVDTVASINVYVTKHSKTYHK